MNWSRRGIDGYLQDAAQVSRQEILGQISFKHHYVDVGENGSEINSCKLIFSLMKPIHLDSVQCHHLHMRLFDPYDDDGDGLQFRDEQEAFCQVVQGKSVFFLK